MPVPAKPRELSNDLRGGQACWMRRWASGSLGLPSYTFPSSRVPSRARLKSGLINSLERVCFSENQTEKPPNLIVAFNGGFSGKKPAGGAWEQEP